MKKGNVSLYVINYICRDFSLLIENCQVLFTHGNIACVSIAILCCIFWTFDVNSKLWMGLDFEGKNIKLWLNVTKKYLCSFLHNLT